MASRRIPLGVLALITTGCLNIRQAIRAIDQRIILMIAAALVLMRGPISQRVLAGALAARMGGNAAAELPDGLAKLLWSFAPPPRPARPASNAEVPPLTPESTAMAKALKKRGFRFVGPTTAYALMQATGMVDDHLAGCHVATVAR